MKDTRIVLCLGLGAFLFLSACAPAPKTYNRPIPPIPAAWKSGVPDQDAKTAPGAPLASDLKWQDFFTDDKLGQIIRMTLENNRDLRIAALNVEKVQTQYRIQRAQQYPTVSVAASADGYRKPASMSNNNEPQTVGQFIVGGGVASWEPDLFGRIRSLKDQALEQYLATEQARTATQISLVAAVAGSYLNMAADRDSLRLAEATLAAQQATYKLIKGKRDQGIGSDLELRQAQSQVEAAQLDVVRYTGQLTLDENALNLLVGAPVPANLLPSGLGSDQVLKDISAGVPSEVLLRRPDILAAEHQLKAAYANIGAARAAFFPRIALTASTGFMSGSLQDLFKWGSRTWEFSPQITMPIFDSGTRKANYRVAELNRDALVAQYEKTIQTAFREVSDSLSQRTRLMELQNAQEALLKTLGETYRLSEARYQAGIDSYLSVLVAQRSLYSGQQALVSLRLARLGNLVTLYKVLGGGA